MSYTVVVSPQAEDDLMSIDRAMRARVVAKANALAGAPFPPGSKALKGDLQGLRRVRVGNYRIAYFVDEATREVVVTQIGHRSKTYEHLKRRGH